MTNKQKHKLWLRIAKRAENPDTNALNHCFYGTPTYHGLCQLMSMAGNLRLSELSGILDEFHWIFGQENNTGFFWRTDIDKSDNGDRILAAYFMAEFYRYNED